MTSCESFLEEEINTDPNNPYEVPVNAMLPSITLNITSVTGGSFSRFNSLLTQQIEGVARQWSSFNNYSGLTPNRFDFVWTTMYDDILYEIDLMLAQSEERGLNHYTAVGQVLKAYSLMMMTDVWGDIPYTEMGQGLDLLNPKFDDQETVIYPEIFSLLNKALANFALEAGPIVPGNDDIFYGGNIDNWIKATYAIRARAYIHQSDYINALADAEKSFESRDDNMRYYFSSSASGNWFRFNTGGRRGDIEFNPFMANLMDGLNDTARKDVFGQTFNGGHPYLIAAFGQDIISYREIQFIIAECLFRNGGSTTEMNNAYLNGIKASFDEVSLSAEYSNYISNSAVNPGAGSLELNDILTQKYIGLFVQPEVFNDYRRTGFPNLTPTSGSEIPVRWNYSGDEMLFNSNAPSPTETTLFTPKVDWDN